MKKNIIILACLFSALMHALGANNATNSNDLREKSCQLATEWCGFNSTDEDPLQLDLSAREWLNASEDKQACIATAYYIAYTIMTKTGSEEFDLLLNDPSHVGAEKTKDRFVQLGIYSAPKFSNVLKHTRQGKVSDFENHPIAGDLFLYVKMQLEK